MSSVGAVALGIVLGWLWLLVAGVRPQSWRAAIFGVTLLGGAVLIAVSIDQLVAPLLGGAVAGAMGHALWRHACAMTAGD